MNNEKRKILYSDSSLWVEDGHQAVCDDCDWTVPRGEAGCMLRAVCAACAEVRETSQDLQLFVSNAMKARRAVEAAGPSFGVIQSARTTVRAMQDPLDLSFWSF